MHEQICSRSFLLSTINQMEFYEDIIPHSLNLGEIEEKLCSVLRKIDQESTEIQFFHSLALSLLYQKKTIFDKVTIYMQKALQLRSFVHVEEAYLVKLMCIQANQSFHEQKPELGINHFKKIARYYKEKKDVIRLAQMYYYALAHLQKLDKYQEEATHYVNKLIPLLEKFESEYSSLYYNAIATSLINYGEDMIEGITYYLKSLKLSRKYNNLTMEIVNLYCIGTDYLELHQKYDESLRYLLPLLEKEKWNEMNPLVKSGTLISICYSYLGKQDHEEAKKYLFVLEQTILHENFTLLLQEQVNAAYYKLKCRIYFHQYEGDELIAIAEQAKELYEKNKNHFRFIHFDIELKKLFGDIYFKVGKYDTALTIYNDALELANLYNRTNFIMDIYKSISYTCEALGQYQQAFESFRRYDEFYKQWQKNILISTYEALHKDFETAEQENQIHLLNKVNEELNEKNNYDGLTNVYNRQILEEYMINTTVISEPMSVIMLDIDCFKLYNDNYGHLAGDEVLKTVAVLLTTICVRKSDRIIRYGGEEFLIFLESTDKQGVQVVAQKIIDGIAKLAIPHSYSVVKKQLTVSMGGSTIFPYQVVNYQELIEQADTALYYSKEKGRNQFIHFENMRQLQENS